MTICYQCINCKHYLGILTCEAFPGGIPEEIVLGVVSHKKPYPGDNGITWEAADKLADRMDRAVTHRAKGKGKV